MTFPYKIKVDRCIGNCNNITNPYSRVCIPDIIKNISVKVFDLISQQNEIRRLCFHESFKCDCLLNETVCNDKQKWNKDRCRYECLKIEKCDNNYFLNVLIVNVNILIAMLNKKIEMFYHTKIILNKKYESLIESQKSEKIYGLHQKRLHYERQTISYVKFQLSCVSSISIFQFFNKMF